MAKVPSPIETLRGVALFQGLSKRELRAILEVAKEVEFAAGGRIVSEGKSGAGFHLILEGSAKVSARGRTFRRLGPGEYFGEISLIDGGPRSATVAAEGDVRTLSLVSWEFLPLLEKHPSIAVKLLQVVVTRLRGAQASPTD